MFHFYTPWIVALTLTHAKLMLHFYTPWKRQCYISIMFWKELKKKHLPEMG